MSMQRRVKEELRTAREHLYGHIYDGNELDAEWLVGTVQWCLSQVASEWKEERQ